MLVSAYLVPKLSLTLCAVGLAFLLCACSREVTEPAKRIVAAAPPAPAPDPHQRARAARDAEFAQAIKPFVTSFCVDCHDADIFKGKLDLAALADGASLEQHRETWEKVFAKLRHGEMPPKDEPRPSTEEFRTVVQWPPQRAHACGVLTVSSYANRTSPVLRGKYILENILNSPPPPPPGDVPSLEEDVAGVTKSLRESLEAHRAKPVWASCHVRMDPLGFGLENFDPVGKWREKAGKFDIDSSGALPDGRTFTGPAELTAILSADPMPARMSR